MPGNELRPEIRAARAKLSLLDQVVRFWADGGCTEAGGAHVPAELASLAGKTIIVGLAVIAQRDGGLPAHGRDLAEWAASLARFTPEPAPAIVDATDTGWMGCAEAATALGVTRQHVYRLIRRQWLDSQRVGNVHVLRRRQVLELREARGSDSDDDY